MNTDISVGLLGIALIPLWAGGAAAQVSTPATPIVGTPTQAQEPPPGLSTAPAPNLPLLASQGGPLPASLTLERALIEAEARSPAIIAAKAKVEAAEARLRQAGVRPNPELSLQVENFGGTGPVSGVRTAETTLSVNQPLDLGGRRSARVAAARADLAAEQLRLAVARADLAQQVREQFATAVSAGERLRIAAENDAVAREVSRVASILVKEGREPPLRAIRARSAAAQAAAQLEAARADEHAARNTFATLFGTTVAPTELRGGLLDLKPQQINPEQSLDVRLADAERLRAEAEVAQQSAAARLNPAVGVGVRHINETGDVGLVAGMSMTLPLFDRNRGNITAARSEVRAAEANLANARAAARVKARNAIINVEAAAARVAALEQSAVPEAAEALRLAQLSYAEGRATLLELLDAQNAYRDAQASLVDARLAQARATAELGRASAQ